MFSEREKYKLSEAAQKGELQEVKTLIEMRGIPVDCRTREILCTNGYRVKGSTALHQAAQNLHVDIVEYLLKLNADPNAVTEGEEWTPLHAVAVNSLSQKLSADENDRAIKVINLLLKAGADLNKIVIVNGIPYTALNLARKWNKLGIIPTLLEARPTNSTKPNITLPGNKLESVINLMPPLQKHLADLMHDLFTKHNLPNNSYSIIPPKEWKDDFLIRGKIIYDLNGCMETYGDAPLYIFSILTRTPRDILQFKVGPGVFSQFSGIYSGAGASIKAVNLIEFERYVKNKHQQKLEPKFFNENGSLISKEYTLRQTSFGAYVLEEKDDDVKNEPASHVYKAFRNSKQTIFKVTVKENRIRFNKSDDDFKPSSKSPTL